MVKALAVQIGLLVAACLVALGYDSLAQAQSAMAEPTARYYCYDEDRNGYILWLKPGGRAEASADDGYGQVIPGTYRRSGQNLSLSLPAIGFSETAIGIDAYNNLIVAFETPSVGCKLTGHDVGPKVAGYARCPNIGYFASSGGYETNHFEFFEDGLVVRKRWREYTITSSTRRAEMRGAYLIEGDQLFMAFADDEEHPLLTAQIHADQSFSVAELEPDKGPCVPD